MHYTVSKTKSSVKNVCFQPVLKTVQSRYSDGFPKSGGVKQGRGGETSYFLALCVNISKTV